MDAEQLTFPDQTFDLIVCNGVLHHLDLRYAYPELARVLKPGGRILCLEALGYNPAIQLYRKLTPHLRTAWEAEHILTMRQVKEAGLFFRRSCGSNSSTSYPLRRFRFEILLSSTRCCASVNFLTHSCCAFPWSSSWPGSRVRAHESAFAKQASVGSARR